MDELIELLIRAIGRWLSGVNTPKTPPPLRPSPGSTPTNFSTPGAERFLPKPMSAQSRIRAAMAPAAKTRPFTKANPPARKAVPSGRRSPARRPAPAPVMIADPIVTEIVSKPGTTSPILRPLAASVTAVKPSVRAETIRKWMTPNTLRKQFMLTEIFQPPVAMRDERH
jgi:hypothetical protein